MKEIQMEKSIFCPMNKQLEAINICKVHCIYYKGEKQSSILCSYKYYLPTSDDFLTG